MAGLFGDDLFMTDNISFPLMGGWMFNWSDFTCENSNHTTHTFLNLIPAKGPVNYVSQAVFGLVFCFGIFGNMIVMYVTGYRKKKRNLGDGYIFALAFSDFLSSLAVALVLISDTIVYFSTWLHNKTIRLTLFVISDVTTYASGWFLVLISLDRYRVISKPLGQKHHWSALYRNVAVVIVTSLGVCLPRTLLERPSDANSDCLQTMPDSKAALVNFIKEIAPVTFSPLVPSVIIVPVYCLTTRALKANTMKHDNNRAMELRNKQNAEIVKMFIIIVMVFLLLTMPFSICVIYESYLASFTYFSPQLAQVISVTYIMYIPASANCCANPIIYAKLHRDINGYLKGIIKRVKGLFCNG